MDCKEIPELFAQPPGPWSSRRRKSQAKSFASVSSQHPGVLTVTVGLYGQLLGSERKHVFTSDQPCITSFSALQHLLQITKLTFVIQQRS